jgi:hypothetical protein
MLLLTQQSPNDSSFMLGRLAVGARGFQCANCKLQPMAKLHASQPLIMDALVSTLKLTNLSLILIVSRSTVLLIANALTELCICWFFPALHDH